eukprot:TRINITY_DN3470_c0_g1_i8.p1 TRINITY_DN3470_c0_g1~~TRINITY_DN3470_c0_g1_i8.p1  ORF type:complete len:139 (+),score=23.84 TRINITY_DN3470_c0_g1_i8:593-1009(+)
MALNHEMIASGQPPLLSDDLEHLRIDSLRTMIEINESASSSSIPKRPATSMLWLGFSTTVNDTVITPPGLWTLVEERYESKMSDPCPPDSDPTEDGRSKDVESPALVNPPYSDLHSTVQKEEAHHSAHTSPTNVQVLA